MDRRSANRSAAQSEAGFLNRAQRTGPQRQRSPQHRSLGLRRGWRGHAGSPTLTGKTKGALSAGVHSADSVRVHGAARRGTAHSPPPSHPASAPKSHQQSLGFQAAGVTCPAATSRRAHSEKFPSFGASPTTMATFVRRAEDPG
ncbi:hypothetical protein AAFF_G00267720 [Aldrovandia affinis]|uniref:Uncharacterized protein n=1 Tax=Aldrovandia affinis TaxID=143900 RepID=A0AAD7WSU1_9TELE|nr:hypothetical protein AAFF_G00267720 [Aldrovandia affinis]